MSSSYVKARADQKRKLKGTYHDKLFIAAAQVLPSVVLRSPPDATESEMVDEAVILARSLLAELGYKYPGMGEENEPE